MAIQKELSPQQQAEDRKKLLIISFINGLSFTCISKNVLSLFLLKAGCPPSLVTIIASFLFLGTVFAFIAKFLISKRGLASTMLLSWLLRSTAALFLGLVPFLAYFGFNSWIMVFLTLFSFLIFASRSFGVVTLQPLFREVVNNENRGKFSSHFFLFYCIATLITMGCIYYILKFSSSILTFQGIIFFGAITGFICTLVIRKVQESTAPTISAQNASFVKTISQVWNNSTYRKFLIVRSLAVGALIITVSVSVIALKNVYNVSDQTALFFSLIQLCGSIVITYMGGILSEFTGPKPLITIYIVLLIIVSLMWILAPYQFNGIYVGVIFFLCGAGFRGVFSSLMHYFLVIAPEDNVGMSLMYSLTSGLFAGIAGIFIGGGFLKFFAVLNFNDFLIYRSYYAIMVFLLLIVLFFVNRLEAVKDWKVSKVLGLLFTPKDMLTLYFLYGLEKYSGQKQEYANVDKLEQRPSELAEDTMLYYLKSPRMQLRLKALRGLNRINYSKKSKKAIIEELKNGEFSTGYLAAIVLGEGGVQEAVPILRKYLKSNDVYLKGNSMIALSMLKDSESYQAIIRNFKETNNPRLLICGSIAIANMERHELISLLLKKTQNPECPKVVYQEILCSTARLSGTGDPFYKFLRMSSNNQRAALLNLSENLDLSYKICKDNKYITPYDLLQDFYENSCLHEETLQILTDSIATYRKKDKASNILEQLYRFLNSSDFNHIREELVYLFILISFKK